MSKIRTRYAPSPTGYFHIGGARTALFNYLFAKHNNGDFIVRIEDTDIERNVENGAESQLNNLNWLGIIPDESPFNPKEFGPYFQSQKFKKYEELAYSLVEQDKAYFCFCTKDELDQQRHYCEENHLTPKYNRKCLSLTKQEINKKISDNVPYVIRLKVKDNYNYEWDDLIRGKISVPSDSMTDPVILKSNKIAMYNFAVVVDDYDMKITHVLRGEEHISNTPYQIAIKQALGYGKQEIKYGHLSIITNSDGKKLSKRDTNLKQFIEDYKNLGYLPTAIVNFLSLLGWTPSNNKEIMDINTLIKEFNIESINKSPAKFDEEKLKWVSSQHFKKMDNQQYLNFVEPFVKSTNKVFLENKEAVLLLFKNQISYACEVDNLIDEYFNFNSNSKELLESIMEFKNEIHSIYPIFIEELNNVNNLNVDNIKQIISIIQNKTNLKAKSLYMPIRILSSLKTHGPELNTLLVLIGKQQIINNINEVLKYAK